MHVLFKCTEGHSRSALHRPDLVRIASNRQLRYSAPRARIMMPYNLNTARGVQGAALQLLQQSYTSRDQVRP